MTDSPFAKHNALWDRLAAAHRAFIEARTALLADPAPVVELVRSALNRPSERSLAIDVTRHLSEDDQKKLFPDLLALSCYAHGLSDEAADILMSMPRDWVIHNIETHEEAILRNATYEEYRMLIRIYDRICPTLAKRLAERAAQSDDEDIREAGEDYLARGLGAVTGTS